MKMVHVWRIYLYKNGDFFTSFLVYPRVNQPFLLGHLTGEVVGSPCNEHQRALG